MKKLAIGMAALFSAFVISACGNEEVNPDEVMENEEQTETEGEEHSEMDEHGDVDEDEHAHMDHSSSGEVPEGLEEADNPTYEVGSHAMITDGHMAGMEGAEATIVGAYDTMVYAVSYDPTDGGPREENHKWVIHEELEEADQDPFEPGDEVTLNADHMAGMEGAEAVIDSAQQTTVYMVDFTLTDSGEEVVNHKWVTEEELSELEHSNH
ncbi:hypothetical protein BpOF4_13005 [Alkalihalophilus pseudofirmus OF4]|uniref:DUF1541 domain-containing protein n=1 Tax=Alkalihalophilus pseudofirmus (strain ATCC BAA-2126 / JCM 17055 / OF4) TaxID=398511 RepID=D3FXE1_ALKPO|nr:MULTISPECIES: YdhK family protein [Alkalihalophilus]ADC50652.1 hypothetical protein BpOF4_13005 [Alkalihalophilus pseudofirmus OF4]MED1602584.1 YdhK family protein [Alkalihalophilus marmarensis]